MLGGPNLIVWLVLAFGGAMFAGNVAALLRPPGRPPGRPAGRTKGATTGAALPQAPRRRTIAMAAVGAVVSLWAIASLLR